MAVRAFLDEKISFPEIYGTIMRTLDAIPFIQSPTLDDYVETHRAAITFAEQLTGCKIPLR